MRPWRLAERRRGKRHVLTHGVAHCGNSRRARCAPSDRPDVALVHGSTIERRWPTSSRSDSRPTSCPTFRTCVRCCRGPFPNPSTRRPPVRALVGRRASDHLDRTGRAARDRRRVRIVDADGVDRTAALPELAGLAVRVAARSAILDGELVVVDQAGRADSAALARRLGGGTGAPAAFLAFDLLHLDGRSLLSQPLVRRRETLRRVLRPGDEVVAVPAIATEGVAMFEAAVAQGIAGVLARHRHSPYLPGARSRMWRFVATKAPGRGPADDPADPAPRSGGRRPGCGPGAGADQPAPVRRRLNRARPRDDLQSAPATRRWHRSRPVAQRPRTPAPPGRVPYSSTPAAYIRVAARRLRPRSRATSSATDRTTSHGSTRRTISRASITNGLNGGHERRDRHQRPAPPPSATIAEGSRSSPRG